MANFLSKIRFLPLTIFVAALLLTVKVGDIWNGVDGVMNGLVSVSKAKAQLDAATPPAPAQEPNPQPLAAEPLPSDAPAPPKDPSASSVSIDDPTLLTQTEIDLLQKLAERREMLDNRENEIDIRLGMLNAAESRIDKKVAKLKNFQAAISKLIKTYDDQQDAKMTSLVKIYESMKPKDAALIFQELEMNTLLLVVERMKERKLAPIMAKMNPARATEITVELSHMRNLPKPGLSEGG